MAPGTASLPDWSASTEFSGQTSNGDDLRSLSLFKDSSLFFVRSTLPNPKPSSFDLDQGGDEATAELVLLRIGVRTSESDIGDMS
ncbi:hypothetical protein [Mesorhizobium sp. M00.F.Ca.ET.216.01.1.1]|uniref:hypothetical protein n=1 Tax=Mesorhizobium sp. M00.F.Ca.ET.216.01.1.1 TaxID=2500528 RepID=UPI000FDAC9BD|nr:hypothetical protein [Mesorhizobium sp. M00.F.Ca.ET.216.01.1.1]TJW40194.1 MAG: hypothetical protein E5W83_29150 [Mesorhizobium sp.]